MINCVGTDYEQSMFNESNSLARQQKSAEYLVKDSASLSGQSACLLGKSINLTLDTTIGRQSNISSSVVTVTGKAAGVCLDPSDRTT